MMPLSCGITTTFTKTFSHYIKSLRTWFKKDGNISKQNNYDICEGMTNKMIVTNQTFSVHALLRFFDENCSSC